MLTADAFKMDDGTLRRNNVSESVCVFCNIWKLGKGKFENKRAIFEILADSKFKLCLTLLLINAALKDPRR